MNNTYYCTFGTGTLFKKKYIKFYAPDDITVRMEMTKMFNTWSSIYTEKEWNTTYDVSLDKRFGLTCLGEFVLNGESYNDD